MQVEAHRVHDDEHDGEHERHRQRDDDAGAPAEREEADEQHDRQRFDEGVDKLTDRVLDNNRLIGDLLEIEAPRYRGHEIGGGVADSRPELENIGALRHHDADANCGLVFLPDHEIGRIGEAVRHGCDVAQPENATIGFNRRLGDGLGAVESAGYAQRHALRRGFNNAGRHDSVLPGKRLEELIAS